MTAASINLPFRRLSLGVGAAFMLVVSSPVLGEAFVEGRDYELVEVSKSVPMPKGKVEVREFFWYGCPHCYALEPYIEKWEKPEVVEFIMTPAMLGKTWVDQAYAYYALKQLGKEKILHKVLFDAIHGEGKRLFTISQMAGFFESYGVKREDFEAAAKSFLVSIEVKRAEHLAKFYQISGVPAFVINGKYLTSLSMTKGYKRLFEVIDYLAKKESA